MLRFALAAVLVVMGAFGARSTGSNPGLQADAILPMRSHSLFSPYVDSTLQNNYWDYGGDTIIDTNRHVKLTQDRPSERGWLWSRLPIDAKDFEVTVEFEIKGHSPSSGGDGMALWLTSTRAEAGPVFGSRNKWTGLGIILDTFPNMPHRGFFPRISLVQNNGDMTYDTEKDGQGQGMAHCSIPLGRTSIEPRLRLTYVNDVYLELAVQNREWNQWQRCFIVSAPQLPPETYLGFSASTGQLTDSHSIVSVWTNSIVYHSRSPADLEAERKRMLSDPENDKQWWTKTTAESMDKKEPGVFMTLLLSILWLFKWTLILSVLAVVGFFAYRYYVSVQRSNMKRRTLA